MNRENIEAIQQATVTALAAQVERVFQIARIKGWTFPEELNPGVGVTVVAATAVATKMKVRLDDVSFETVISSINTAKDIQRTSDELVEKWLEKHATSKPPARRRVG
jgi:hypothetical protein